MSGRPNGSAGSLATSQKFRGPRFRIVERTGLTRPAQLASLMRARERVASSMRRGKNMQDISEDDLIALLRRGHKGPPEALEGAIARVRGGGPFKRVTLLDD